MQTVLQDLRFASRQLRRSPFFSLTLMVTLALSVGATAALTGVLRATLLHRLPYPQSSQLVEIGDENLRGFKSSGLISVLRTQDLAALQTVGGKVFSKLSYFYFENSALALDAQTSFNVSTAAVSGSFFETAGSGPLLGRTIMATDDLPNSPQVLVISYQLWQTKFGADPKILGRTVKIGPAQATVVGVLPKEFGLPAGIDLWHPGHVLPTSFIGYRGEGSRFVRVLARLAPGSTVESARVQSALLADRLAKAYPETDAAWGFEITALRDSLFGPVRQPLLLLAAAVALVLLVATINIAGLQLSRNAARAPEFALRGALGVTRGRLTRQLITESLLLVLSGSFIGVGLAWVLLRAVATRLPDTLLVVDRPQVDPIVVMIAMLAALLVGLLTAALPVLQAGTTAAPAAGRSMGGRTVVGRNSFASKIFATLQIALSLVLLTLSASVLQHLYRLLNTPLGFDVENLQTFSVDLPWGSEPEKTRQLYDRLEAAFAAIPGVASAGSMNALPFSSFSVRGTYDIAGHPPTPQHDTVIAEERMFSLGYLATVHIPLLAGRAFTAQDGAPHMPLVVTINQTLAEKYFPTQSPVGQRLTTSGQDGKPYVAEIVGVIGDVHGTGGSLGTAPLPEIYEPMRGYWPHMQFVLRSNLGSQALERQVHGIVAASSSTATVGDFNTISSKLNRTLVQPRLNASLLTAFAILSLLLVIVGVYGLVAFDIAQRTRELGLRIALGSSRSGVVGLFLAESSRMLLTGLALGLAGSTLVSRLLAATIFGSQVDASPQIMVASLLLVIAVLTATLLPASHAARIDPIQALRSE